MGWVKTKMRAVAGGQMWGGGHSKRWDRVKDWSSGKRQEKGLDKAFTVWENKMWGMGQMWSVVKCGVVQLQVGA